MCCARPEKRPLKPTPLREWPDDRQVTSVIAVAAERLVEMIDSALRPIATTDSQRQVLSASPALQGINDVRCSPLSKIILAQM